MPGFNPFRYRFPYTNINDINLDWIIKQVKQLASALQGKQDKPDSTGTAGQVLGLDSSLNPVWVDQSGGGGGTTNYNNLENKPQINSVTLSGNISAAELGLANYRNLTNKPQINGVALNGNKSASDLGLNIPGYSLQLPVMDGEASAGTNFSRFAMEGHRHPTDISRASAAELATYVRPNLLDNWYFVGGGSQLGHGVFPINQRGQTIYINANSKTIDRWTLVSGSMSVVSGGITLDGTITQVLPSSIGRPVTASALLSDGTMLTPTYDDNTKTLTLSATGQTIVAVKLEIGSTQTLAHQENNAWVLNEVPGYVDQLLACQTSDPFYDATGLLSTVGTIAAGGVAKIGRFAIVNVRIALTTNITGSIVVLNGLPRPLTASANYVAVMTNYQVTNNYVDGSGNVHVNGALESGTILIIACSYLTN